MTADPREQLAARLAALRMPAPPSAEDVAALAAREFTASDPDGAVTAVVSGAGELLRLEVSALATRGDERDRVGERTVQAVNGALDQAAAARAALGPQQDVTAKLDEITAAFTARMDSLLARLDDLGRSQPG